MSLFRCPLCAAPLVREAGACRCPGGHSFDIAKEGYVHLLPSRATTGIWYWPGGSSYPKGIINPC